jgi:hypothetical protein
MGPRKLSYRQSISQLGNQCDANFSTWQDSLLIGTMYRLPNSSSDNNKVLNSLLPSMTFSRSHTSIVGDFNHSDIDWAEESSPRDGNHPASLFLESVRDSFLIQNITKPTHLRGKQTPNILDLVFTSEVSMIDELRHEAP